jgi:hypothetical protein
MASAVFSGFLAIAGVVQMFVLGPRLILSIRDHRAKLVFNSQEGTAMTTIAFQERVHVSTGATVMCRAGDSHIQFTLVGDI